MTTLFLTDYDSHLLAEGNHYRSYEKLGAHVCEVDGVTGTHFAVIAPSASAVAVIGDFNGWEESADPMARREAGLWTRFVPGVQPGALYKYRIRSAAFQGFLEKADPYGFWAEQRPQTASRVCDLSAYEWQDSAWMASRGARNRHDSPISIYEVHLGSWRRVPEEGDRWLTYRELAERLADYVEELGFTHVELLPISEHPFDGSWGYQTTGYYAPTSRFGSPLDFMAMVDYLHQRGIGVILDWAPAHFPNDPHGLSWFDGTYFYEHMDPRQGTHPHWNTLVFNYGRWEVRNFLISSALFWLDRYHIDGLRVDAVASMLYLDYGRDPGGWVPNPYGGRENVDAVEFLQRLNHEVYGRFPDVLMVAEESTAWPNVSRPTFQGGLGFGFKWNMGWMHDTLGYMRHEPIHRAYHHDQLTFSLVYAHTENFVLPFSHDEVVHGKGSLIGKMPGDEWQKYANLRLLFGYMFAHPGKKLLFMGGEFGQHREWNHDRSLDWHLLDEPAHRGLQRWVGDLNAQLRAAPALFQLDNEPAGFRWIDCHDGDRSLLSFWRLGTDPADRVLVACNFTPVPRYDYVVGVPTAGEWEERLNSDADRYGGSGMGNLGRVWTSPSGAQGEPYSVRLTLPPLAVLFLGPKAP